MDQFRSFARRASYPALLIMSGVALLLALAFVPALRSAPGGDAEASAVSPYLPLYFEVNGQTTSGPFLGYWFSNSHIGEPVSPIVMHNGHWTQWFEYARLELHDVPFDVATGADVTETPIGEIFAEAVGHTSQLEAFVPKKNGAERFFPDTGHSLTSGFRTAYEQPGIPERLGPPISDEFSIGETVYQFFQYGAFSWTSDSGVIPVAVGLLDAGLNGQVGGWQELPEGALDGSLVRQIAESSAWDDVGMADAFSILAGSTGAASSLGEFDMMYLADYLPGERWIEIDKGNFTTTAWVGNVPVFRTIVVTGHEEAETPTGDFNIWLMYESQDMDGIGWDGNPYAEANVPWVAYFFQDYAIHGTTWRTEFGYKDSQGCVIPPNYAAEALWHFADYGMRVTVHE